MRRLLPLLSLFAVIAPARADVLRGVVVDAHGEPLSGREVFARGIDADARTTLTVMTAADGAFSIDAGPPPWVVAVGRSPRVHALRIESAAPSVRIVVPDPVVVEGTLRDQHGRPLAKAHFRLEERFELWMRGGENNRDFSQTDAEGRFSFAAVMPGSYEVVVPDLPPVGLKVPGPVSLVLQVPSRVTGHVRTEDGATPRFVRVHGARLAPGAAFDEPQDFFPSRFFDVSAPGYAAHIVDLSAVTPGPFGALEVGEITLVRGRELRGVVRDAWDGAPLPHAVVRFPSTFENVYASDWCGYAKGDLPAHGWHVETDAEGRFSLRVDASAKSLRVTARRYLERIAAIPAEGEVEVRLEREPSRRGQ